MIWGENPPFLETPVFWEINDGALTSLLSTTPHFLAHPWDTFEGHHMGGFLQGPVPNATPFGKIWGQEEYMGITHNT